MFASGFELVQRAALRVWQAIQQIRPIYIAIIVAAIVAQFALIYLDAFDLLHEVSRAHEDWEVDEWFTSLSVLAVVFLAVLIVRAADLKREAKRRASAETQLGIALANMHQGLSMFDAEQRLVICNDRYLQMYGLTSEQTKPGTTVLQLLERRGADWFPRGATPAEYERKLLTSLSEKSSWVDIYELNDGRAVSIAYRRLANGGWVSTHDDITERRRIEERVAHMAHHDAATGLPNRLLFRERLAETLAQMRRGESLVVLYLDLDRFKEINDSLGHAMGDALLKAAAERLSQCISESDVIARMGGDEFAILQITSAERPTDTTALVTRIIETVGAPFELNGHRMTIGISTGIAISPNDGIDPDQLVKNAGLALRRARSEGHNGYRFFELEMDQRMQARRTMERDLRNALVNGEFELYYQPVVNLDDNAVSGVEALLRWNHPERGRVSPAEFIPLAEETGLIVPIGEWVLRRACSEAAKWPAQIKVAVNLSPIQFKSRDLISVVVGALTAANLSARRLEIEVTESVLLQDTDEALATLGQLRNLGVRIALDDFGTGYSSLSYLRSFPFNKLKIDRCFISDLTDKADESVAILRAIANLGSSLGMVTTAEGVETKEQLDKVRAEGCTEMQGYYFSAPKPASEIATLLLTPKKVVTAA